MAGKRAKCPKCLMVFTLPATGDRPATRREDPSNRATAALDDAFQDSERYDADRKRSKRVDDDVDDRDRDEPRPRPSRSRRSTGGSALPWILGLGGVAAILFLLCGGTLVAIAVYGFGGAKKGPAQPVVAVNNPPIANPPIGNPPIGNPPVANPPIGNPPIGKPPIMKPPIGNPPPFPNVGPGQAIQLKQGPGTRIQLANGQAIISSTLGAQDPFDPEDKQFRCKLYSVDLQQGRTYVIDMTSPNFQQLDPYLRVEDTNEQVLARDDDSGGGLNARIFFTPAYTGSFVIVATSFHPNNFGPFTLAVRQNK
jgi:hypothetical protein